MKQILPERSALSPIRYGVLISYYGLLLYFGALSAVTTGTLGSGSLLIWLFLAAPLVPFAWGLKRQHMRTYFWLSLMVLLYFIGGVLVALDPSRRWLGMVQIVLCFTLFVSLSLSVRVADS